MANIHVNVRYLDPIPPVLVRFEYGRGKSKTLVPVVFTRSPAQTMRLCGRVFTIQIPEEEHLMLEAVPLLTGPDCRPVTGVQIHFPGRPSFRVLSELATFSLVAKKSGVPVAFHGSGGGCLKGVSVEQLAAVCLDVSLLGLPDDMAGNMVMNALQGLVDESV